jgi:5'-3' exonuclease
MVLVDMNQVTLSSLMVQIGQSKDLQVNPDLVRHMVLNSIRTYRIKFVEDYGELVLCYDSKHYWRKDVFPQYKSHRKKMRESSDFDWNTIFNTLNALKEELRENFPYKMLEVYGAEADDIIATICESQKENIMIVSGDKDFIQLQKYKNVKQWNPVQKKMLKDKNPDLYLKEHIIKGDRSDGIPNVLSDDNSFVDKIRQKPLTKKKIQAWVEHDFMDVAPNEEAKRNYHRNTTLVDLSKIPQDLKDKIKETYKTTPILGDRKNLINYFINNKLKELTNNLGDF